MTFLEPTPPIFWERAAGANVWDADDNRYVDLTAAFGVAAVGHAHPRVVTAVRDQAGTLLHGMGDVHPSRLKVDLLEVLAARFPTSPTGRPVEVRGVLGSSGSDAVETALKTALLATGRASVVAFEGAYHGLALGALDTTWRRDFRDPFAARLPARTGFARFGDLDHLREVAAGLPSPIGAVLIEPVQGRGGERIPPPGFLAGLRALCDSEGWLLVADEIYTGFGRTGRYWGCDHESVVPDLLCAGKGMGSGMPISACIGRADVMDAWPISTGEALHTQTFLGHPLGCAAALASIATLEAEGLVERAATIGALALEHLNAKLRGSPAVADIRGLGLMIGVELASAPNVQRVVAAALEKGIILLPSGDRGQVLSITPPLTIDGSVLLAALDVVIELVSTES